MGRLRKDMAGVETSPFTAHVAVLSAPVHDQVDKLLGQRPVMIMKHQHNSKVEIYSFLAIVMNKLDTHSQMW